MDEASHKVVGWDELVPDGTNEEFQRVDSHLAELRAITFPRVVKPKEAVVHDSLQMELEAVRYFDGRAGDDPQGVGDLPGVRRYKGE